MKKHEFWHHCKDWRKLSLVFTLTKVLKILVTFRSAFFIYYLKKCSNLFDPHNDVEMSNKQICTFKISTFSMPVSKKMSCICAKWKWDFFFLFWWQHLWNPHRMCFSSSLLKLLPLHGFHHFKTKINFLFGEKIFLKWMTR